MKSLFGNVLKKLFCPRYDFVEIRDGGSPNSPLVGRYCGGSIPPEYVSSGSRVYVRFKTDHSVAHDGFRIAYEIGKYRVTHLVVLQVLLTLKQKFCFGMRPIYRVTLVTDLGWVDLNFYVLSSCLAALPVPPNS